MTIREKPASFIKKNTNKLLNKISLFVRAVCNFCENPLCFFFAALGIQHGYGRQVHNFIYTGAHLYHVHRFAQPH